MIIIIVEHQMRDMCDENAISTNDSISYSETQENFIQNYKIFFLIYRSFCWYSVISHLKFLGSSLFHSVLQSILNFKSTIRYITDKFSLNHFLLLIRRLNVLSSSYTLSLISRNIKQFTFYIHFFPIMFNKLHIHWLARQCQFLGIDNHLNYVSRLDLGLLYR